MTYFMPEKEWTERCPRCGRWDYHKTGMMKLGCAVAHAPGDCCHYGEQEVEPPVFKALEVRVVEAKS